MITTSYFRLLLLTELQGGEGLHQEEKKIGNEPHEMGNWEYIGNKRIRS